MTIRVEICSGVLIHQLNGSEREYLPFGMILLPSDTVLRIKKWANWARMRPLYSKLETHNHCASVEGRCESGYPESTDPGKATIGHDLFAVLAVERVVNRRLPQINRDLLVCHYVLRRPPKRTTKELHIKSCRYGTELRRSVLMVKNNLTTAKHDA